VNRKPSPHPAAVAVRRRLATGATWLAAALLGPLPAAAQALGPLGPLAAGEEQRTADLISGALPNLLGPLGVPGTPDGTAEALGTGRGVVLPASTGPAPLTPPAAASSVERLADEAGARSQVDLSADSDDPEAPLPQQAAEAVPEGALRPAGFGDADLAPYFATGRLAQAKAEFDARRYGKARALLQGEGDAPPVRYLRALAALKAGQPLTGATELRALAPLYPPLQDRCLMAAAEGFAEAGKRKEAAEAWEAVPAGSRLFPEARERLAKLRQRRGDLAGAVAALTPLVAPGGLKQGSAAHARAWAAIAKLARVQADYHGEHRAMLALWATQPFSPEAEAAWERLRQLPLPVKWKVTRAETLVSLHHNHEALELLEKVLPQVELPDELGCRARFAQGLALRKERKHRLAIEALAPVVQHCRTSEVRPRALWALGYSQSVVQSEAAAATYRTLAEEHPTHLYADDALVLAGEVALRRGEGAAALADWEAALERYPLRESAAEALFRRFWALRARATGTGGGTGGGTGEAGRALLETALTALSRTEQLTGAAATPIQVRRARYWRARTLAQLGRGPEAFALLEEVAQDAGYYGLLARSRLKSESPAHLQRALARLASRDAAGGDDAAPLSPGTLTRSPRFVSGVELLRLGFKKEGFEELAAIDLREHGEQPLRLLYRLYGKLGAEKLARGTARALLRVTLEAPVGEEARRIYAAGYPRPFRPFVVQHSRAADIEPDLLQALVREESAFNARARSATGALGLAQLMPGTARQVAGQLGVRGFRESQLLEPQHNLRLGAAYLGQLRRRFDGSAAHAVASYNAGPGAVERWRRQRPDADLDAWVEDIPFEETRGYVKRVLGSYATYQLLASPGGAQPTLRVGARKPAVQQTSAPRPAPRPGDGGVRTVD
jgi:soluble lytic murein transglycosylase